LSFNFFIKIEQNTPYLDMSSQPLDVTLLSAKIEEETSKLITNGGISHFAKTYLLAGLLDDGEIPIIEPCDLLAAAENETSIRLADEYRRKLYIFRANFIAQNIHKIPPKNWIRMFGSLWQYDISLETFRSLGFSPGLISEISAMQKKLEAPVFQVDPRKPLFFQPVANLEGKPPKVQYFDARDPAN